MAIQIDLPEDEIAVFCERWNVSELALFGSVLRTDFRPDSDVDVLVAFKPETRQTLADLLAMEEELELILGRKVDLGERESVEEDPNYIRRQGILDSTRVIYADR